MRRRYVREFLVIVAVLPLLLLCGCWVFSISSLYDDDRHDSGHGMADDSLLGTFVSLKGGCTLAIEKESDSEDEQSNYYALKYYVPKVNEGEYHHCLLDAPGNYKFTARLFMVGKGRYLEVMPSLESMRDAQNISFLRLHSIVRLSLNGDSLALAPLSYEFITEQSESGSKNSLALLPQIPESEGVAYVTASPTELRAFLIRNENSPNLFESNEALKFRREKGQTKT